MAAVRMCASCRRRAATAILLTIVALVAPSCSRAASLTSVRLRIGGHDVALRAHAVCDGHDVFLPLEALRALGVNARLNPRGDCATVQYADGESAEVALARPGGIMMVPLSVLLPRLNATARVDGDVCEIRPRIEFLGFQDGALRVCAGLPVAAACHTGPDADRPQLSLDIAGADLMAARAPVVPLDDDRVRSVHVEAHGDGIRLTIETAPGVSVGGASGSPQRVRTLALVGATRTARGAMRPEPSAVRVADALPGADARLPGPPPARPHQKSALQAPRAHLDSGISARTAGTRPSTRIASRGPVQEQDPVDTPPARKDDRQKNPPGAQPQASTAREIIGAQVTTTDSDHARLKITTNARVWVSSKMEGDHVAIDFPSTSVDGDTYEWPSDHPLIKSVRAVAGPDSGSTRILVDLNRVAEYRILSEAADGVTILLSAPRAAGKTLHDLIVVVDPGHGGSRDCANAIENGQRVYEKDLTLAIGLKVRALLAEAGANVIITRSSDAAVGLYDRPRLANENNADIFISIHTDDCEIANTASGTTAYYHMDDANSRALAHCIVESIAAVSGLPNRGARSDRVRFHTGMAVLRAATMPATLVELGYINNARDRSKLVDDAFQQRIAQAIFDGIAAYVEGPGSSHVRSSATE